MGDQQKDVYRTTVTVPPSTAARSYEVIVRSDLLDQAGEPIADLCPAHRYAVIADTQVADLYGKRLLEALAAAKLEASLFRFPAGEWNKSRQVWGELCDTILRAGFGRDSAVIALGGGVAGDLAGFVAATYMRGVPVVQVPTSLLAMLDSSVGGKTGLDTPMGKNLIGAFHQPAVVLVDPETLKTLPLPQLAAGLSEAIKHGLILDADYFEEIAGRLPAVFDRDSEYLLRLIFRSVELKAGVVSRDERERGYRTVLNFGHTVGHALETLSGYGWLHGEAVAAGLVAEARIGEAAGVTAAGTAQRVQEVLEAARLPVEPEADVTADRFFRALEVDKKRKGGSVRYTLLTRIGEVAGSSGSGWSKEVPEELVRRALFG
ncbi:MAG: 3-dehydroquinate synthase [Gemmatimonadetes bacterium]|nr:3-dehydroquinate synthase [Gemmatimonadota bacterium]NIU53435.1 3-dehydroquinate synthase [Gemmatimonadota bacterium]NIW37263.1 3-dehydroquinate synthase [Gemmatimonadota bacterium]